MTAELRDKDIAILQAIHDGASTVSEITEMTTLTTREINYSLNEKSLEAKGLVDISRDSGREWQEIKDQERYIWKPKRLQLTDQGIRKLTEHQTGDDEKYEDMSRRELIQRLHELENRMDRMESMFKDFRQKVMDQM